MKIKLRRDTAANWASVDPVLASGQPGWDTTNEELRIGDGVSTWSVLTPIGAGGTGTTNLTWTASTSTVASDTGTDAVITVADGTNPGLMTSANFTKLAGIATGATANSSDATLLARANHTGTQLAATISDFATAVAATAAVTANTAKITNATHTGDVTGATALTIAADAVTYAKMQDVSAASKLLGRGDSGSGDPQEITLGSGLTMTGTTLSSSGSSSVTVIAVAPSSDQADWNPSGLTTGQMIVKAQPTTNAFISGIVGGTSDQRLQLINDSAFVIMLIDEDTTSTAGNRFLADAGSTIILPQENVNLRYSATKSRWVLTNQSKDLFDVRTRSQICLPSTGAAVISQGLHGHTITATASTMATTASPTNDFLEAAYTQVTNSTASGSCDVRSNVIWAMRGGTANRQGFINTGRVRFTAMGATSGGVYAGMTNGTGSSTTLPSAATNIIAIGGDTTDTTLQVFTNDAAGAAAQVDLGANFPIPNANAAYEYLFYAAPNGSSVEYMVRRMDSRFVAQGSISADIPSQTTPLGHCFRGIVGATAAANTVQANYLLTVGL